jgi:purine-binding chemotaxis protein CheW
MATQQAADTGAFIVFDVAGTTYALPSRDVRHMEMIDEVTRVPNAPPFVDGVVFSRGEVVPIVNLRVRFGFERAPYDVRNRLIVVQGEGRQIGLLADSAREFVRIPLGAVQAPGDALAGMSGRYVEGIAALGDRLILLLNLERIVTFSESLPVGPAA